MIIIKIDNDFHYLFLKEAPKKVSVIPDYRPARNPYSKLEIEIMTGLLTEMESRSISQMQNPRLDQVKVGI